MLAFFLAPAFWLTATPQTEDDAFRAIRSGLPSAGVIHLVYASPQNPRQFDLWADPAARTVLHISGTGAVLRGPDGRYSRGVGADTRTGAAGSWEPDDANHVQAAMNLPHPVAQAVLLLAERDHILNVTPEASGGWLVMWQAPSYKVWRFDGTAPAQVDGASSIEFQVSSAGQVLAWRHVETLPEKREGPLFKHDFGDAVSVEQMVVPRFIDLGGKSRRPPTDGVLRLATAEILIDEPPGLFTRDGSLARAAEAAKPLVEAFQRRFYWHDSPEAASMEKLPFQDSTGNTKGPSWSTAFITGGVIVLALGGFAWWRSRR